MPPKRRRSPGRTPAHDIIRDRRLTIPAIAHAIEFPEVPLRNAIYAHNRPSEELVLKLSKFLDVPEHELFLTETVGCS